MRLVPLRRLNKQQQQGYFLVLAVIFIMIIGVMGSMIAYVFSNRAAFSVAQQNGLSAFYMAESGLEIGARLLTMPNLTGTPIRIACASLTGTSAVTNAAFSKGTMTLTAVNNTPYSASTTLSAAATAAATTISVTSAAGLAPWGRVVIDGENIDYAAITGNTLTTVTRGTNGTLASSHIVGAGVGQYQCTVDSKAGIPNLTSSNYQRELQWGVQLQEGWVVGDLSGANFVFSHWNEPTELSWNVTPVAGGGNGANLNAVSMASNADGWSVGDSTGGGRFSLLRWNGSTWVRDSGGGLTACSYQHLLGVSMVSSQEAWAVGVVYRAGCGGGPNRYTVMNWNGTAWSLLVPPTIPANSNSNQTLNAVHVIDTSGNGTGDIGFAVGDAGTILRYNGATWVSATSPTTRNLFGVNIVSASEAWAVGANGVILRWNGTTWSSFTSPTATQLNSIAMLDTNGDGLADIGWAVGNAGRIVTYNGTTWSSSSSGTNNLLAVGILNDSDVWAAGAAGTTLHWDGAAWSSISSGTAVQLNGVSFISPRQKPVSFWRQIFH